MSAYILEIVSGPDAGKRFPLPEGAVSIGRSSQNAIALNPNDRSVSGHHAIIYTTGGRLLLQDLQSTNGTFVNEERVSERALTAGEIIGFGKTGPRMRIIVSNDDAPPTAPPRPTAAVFPGATDAAGRTVNDAADDTGPTMPHELSPSRARDEVRMSARFDDDPFAVRSATMDMEKKLLEKRISVDEMKSLMSNGKRLEKILDRGNLANTQMTMLRAGHEARKKSQATWLIILGCVVTLSAAAIAFFAVRAYQYKAMVDHGLKLEGSIDELEKKIAKAQRDTLSGRAQLRSLVGELERKNEELATVKSRLREDDFGKFYADPIEKKIDEILARFGETNYHVPPQMVERVKHHIGVYTGSLKPVISRYLYRKNKYFPMMTQVFAAKKLPPTLCYISMLESGFNPLALSHAGARGLWQFMPATARRYKLRVDDQVDERIDPEKATNAAVEYFKDLIAEFGGGSAVMLAMAAYNAGEGRVKGALHKIDDPLRNRDFWYLYRMGYLAEETNEYIPRVIALIIISENPQEFGMQPAVETTYASAQQAGDNGLVEMEGLRRLDESP